VRGALTLTLTLTLTRRRQCASGCVAPRRSSHSPSSAEIATEIEAEIAAEIAPPARRACLVRV